MLARGIRSYHRPTRIEEAQDLAAQGASLLGGGTRVLASEAVVPNVVDLIGLGLSGVRVEDEDLLIGAVTPVLDVAGAPAAHALSAGLLPLASRLALPSRILRGMATVGGEAIAADPDSELVAALLVLNAVFLVAHPDEPRESPALRFLSGADKDLRGGGVLRAVLIPGAPDGAALERVAALPSLPPIVAVAATTTMSGDKLARVRLAVTGLAGPPARVIDAEAKLERTAGEPDVLEAAAEIVASHAAFRDDAVASASVRRRMARALTLRALRAALERGKQRVPIAPPRVRANPTLRLPAPMPNFTSGRLELAVNGRPLRAEAEARTTLAELLRGAGLWSVKAGCGGGQLRRLRGAARRPPGRVLPHARGPRPGPQRRHRRGARDGRAAASAAGRVRRGFRLALRLLRSEPRARRARAARRGPAAERGRRARRARRPLPLHRLRRPRRRRDGPGRDGAAVSMRRATGQSAFAGDHALPGMLHLALRRSPSAHARVVRADDGRRARDAGGRRGADVRGRAAGAFRRRPFRR